MIKISEVIADLLAEIPGVGHISEFGAIVGDSKFIIYFSEDDITPYLAHISEFEQKGFLIRLKENK